MSLSIDRRTAFRWFAAALVAGAYAVGQSLAKSPALGKAAAGFDLPIVAGEGVGQRVRLAQHADQVLVLEFWASWCEACRKSVPAINDVHERWSKKGVSFYAVNTESFSIAQVAQAHASFGYTFPTLQDGDGSLAHAYGVHMLPSVIVVGASGRVDYASNGIPRESELTEAIEGAFAR